MSYADDNAKTVDLTSLCNCWACKTINKFRRMLPPWKVVLAMLVASAITTTFIAVVVW